MGIPKRPTPATCRGCTARWHGTRRAHCAACHHTFSSVTAFDRHRTPDGDHGQCLDPATLAALVYRHGAWSWPPMPEHARRRRAGQPPRKD